MPRVWPVGNRELRDVSTADSSGWTLAASTTVRLREKARWHDNIRRNIKESGVLEYGWGFYAGIGSGDEAKKNALPASIPIAQLHCSLSASGKVGCWVLDP